MQGVGAASETASAANVGAFSETSQSGNPMSASRLRRVQYTQPMVFDLRSDDDEVEVGHVVRMIHVCEELSIGDADDEGEGGFHKRL